MVASNSRTTKRIPTELLVGVWRIKSVEMRPLMQSGGRCSTAHWIGAHPETRFEQYPAATYIFDSFTVHIESPGCEAGAYDPGAVATLQVSNTLATLPTDD